MSVKITKASMHQDEDQHYLGQVIFELENVKSPYEISFFSKNGKDWDYNLHFTAQSGDEEEFYELDARLEEDDDLFDELLSASWNTLEQSPSDE
ncbi:hypothetical protein M5X00_10440 [Paenibacillus alvei]|uniref:DUF1292 domain-containing protein n=1 Tax=Paenibacillus alvei TaxID=44250 RepID=A0ABT4GTH9_PAEAL|nr:MULTISPECIES: hypothetical protein [Paenibacillus]EJW17887.1 hypothetical protein PAV_3c03360 [Paenibacillus alvei DSM 29]MCY7483311.1 hypothetical protein [Paenibacillus alvei]MCY9544387.1 hypothetical protein [Paenibacillus alvei]MCY9703393.1 hypothetical protein [Paenibacillus alvei]MCY9738277.1 hypothetical protein [Paenibacillus alvei]